ncbi:hypothetical protein F4677DRAFT_151071 [Hypoxylon crocopeplum]|nr:hypothetical protein F4677DRAFT_151071 [Hypoxylon crocopeplum]
MASVKRPTGVESYGPEAGHYKPQLVEDAKALRVPGPLGDDMRESLYEENRASFRAAKANVPGFADSLLAQVFALKKTLVNPDKVAEMRKTDIVPTTVASGSQSSIRSQNGLSGSKVSLSGSRWSSEGHEEKTYGRPQPMADLGDWGGLQTSNAVPKRSYDRGQYSSGGLSSGSYSTSSLASYAGFEPVIHQGSFTDDDPGLLIDFSQETIDGDLDEPLTPTVPGEAILPISEGKSDGASTTFIPIGLRRVDRDLVGDFRNQDDMWANQNWNAVRQPERFGWGNESYYSNASAAPPPPSKYQKDYIMHWVQSTPDFLPYITYSEVDEPCTCDVSTQTDILMDAVVLPKAPDTGSDDDKAGHGETTEKSPQVPRAPSMAIAKPKLYKRPSWERLPRERYHLRPAYEEDMEQVAKIYNLEVQKSYNVPDKSALKTAAFRGHLRICKKDHLPFFVAVDDWVPRKTRGSAYDDKVMGFAMVDVAARGVTGSLNTYSANHGKLTVVVHPDYRRLNACSGMIGAVLHCCSRNYKPQFVYHLVGVEADATYSPAHLNARMWQYIDLEVVLPSGPSPEAVRESPECKWRLDYLKKWFDMGLVRHEEKMYQDKRCGNSWLDVLTFRHVCRPIE